VVLVLPVEPLESALSNAFLLLVIEFPTACQILQSGSKDSNSASMIFSFSTGGSLRSSAILMKEMYADAAHRQARLSGLNSTQRCGQRKAFELASDVARPHSLQ
jgi:hypothetical protein